MLALSMTNRTLGQLEAQEGHEAGDDGDAVADDRDGSLMAGGDLPQRSLRALRELAEALAARRAGGARIAAKFRLGCPMGQGRLLAPHTLISAPVAFLQPCVQLQRQRVRHGDGRGSLHGPLHGTRVDGAERHGIERFCHGACLPSALVVQRNIEITLDAPDGVPLGATMPDQVE